MHLNDYPATTGSHNIIEVIWLEWDGLTVQPPPELVVYPDEEGVHVEVEHLGIKELTLGTYFVVTLPLGLSYDGNGMINGVPLEPDIDDNQLKWEFSDPWYPDDEWILEFDLKVSSDPPYEMPLEIQVWSYCSAWNRNAYGEGSTIIFLEGNHPPAKPTKPVERSERIKTTN